ncbi:RDD family protein [Paraburkholderia panacisoli]|nr:RDD family protein [Paraburkholderia panacisoli]
MSGLEPSAGNATGTDTGELQQSHITESNALLGAPGSWRRYAARSLDLILWSFVLGLAVSIVNATTGAHLMQFRWSHFVSVTVSTSIYLPLAMFVDAVVCAACGNSVGKAILGVRVIECDGTRPSFRRYLKRNCAIWARGLAFGFPVARQLTMIVSCMVLKREGVTAWDAKLKFRVVRETCTIAHYVVAVLLALALLSVNAYQHARHSRIDRISPAVSNQREANRAAASPAAHWQKDSDSKIANSHSGGIS